MSNRGEGSLSVVRLLKFGGASSEGRIDILWDSLGIGGF